MCSATRVFVPTIAAFYEEKRQLQAYELFVDNDRCCRFFSSRVYVHPLSRIGTWGLPVTNATYAIRIKAPTLSCRGDSDLAHFSQLFSQGSCPA